MNLGIKQVQINKITMENRVSLSKFTNSLSAGLMRIIIGGSVIMSGCASLPLPTKSQVSNGTYGVISTERTVAQRLTDKSIASTAKINIRNLDAELSASRIDVDSFDRVVLLTGEVPNALAKQKVETHVASMPDVIGVYNELKISPPHTLSYHFHDVYITSKIRSKILASTQLSSSQVTIVSEMGVVYVLGRLTQQQRQELLDLAHATPGVLEIVILATIVPG